MAEISEVKQAPKWQLVLSDVEADAVRRAVAHWRSTHKTQIDPGMETVNAAMYAPPYWVHRP